MARDEQPLTRRPGWCWFGLPLDTPLDDPVRTIGFRGRWPPVASVRSKAKFATGAWKAVCRTPPAGAAYVTREACAHGRAAYADERAIVPRSLIAELLFDEPLDCWPGADARPRACLGTGGGSLDRCRQPVVWPSWRWTPRTCSADALAVARITVDGHGLQERITLLMSDGLAEVRGPYDLIISTRPTSMPEAWPRRAPPSPGRSRRWRWTDAGRQRGAAWISIRVLLAQAPAQLTAHGVLVLEIGNERAHFEAAFPSLEPVWLATSAGEDQVLLLTREALGSLKECQEPWIPGRSRRG